MAGDAVQEPNETFFVDLVGSTGPISISADSRGTGTITNDDSPVTASINDVTVTEGDTGTVNATFTVTLSGPAPAPLQIRYSTANGSAAQPGDYTAVTNALLNIGQGASSGQFSIAVQGDNLPEGVSENFFVDLISSTGPVTISADSRGTGTITDDDAPPIASINDVTVTEGIRARDRERDLHGHALRRGGGAPADSLLDERQLGCLARGLHRGDECAAEHP